LLTPERSRFANNYEGNRRFGLMGWGSIFDQGMEYALGTFNGQRNSYQPFDSLQDVMAFINFKPFYNREEGFLLRDLHVGGSVDAGQDESAGGAGQGGHRNGRGVWPPRRDDHAPIPQRSTDMRQRVPVVVNQCGGIGIQSGGFPGNRVLRRIVASSAP
jgi:hypothetical protein